MDIPRQFILPNAGEPTALRDRNEDLQDDPKPKIAVREEERLHGGEFLARHPSDLGFDERTE
jgi:hypothetical protein